VVTSAVSVRAPGSRRRRSGAKIGFALATVTLGFLLAPGQEHLHAPGRMNAGHENLSCESCHRPAPGTTRQQLQANARHLFGLRQHPADFGQKAVDNTDCLACHERPFDRHPVFRFNEPRFVEARKELGPQLCESCHTEHQGARVTAETGYCRTCHADLEMKNDPLDVPHAKLVRDERWDTCLGCHDYHGNHVMKTATRLADRAPASRIEGYFAGRSSPYPGRLKKAAREKRLEDR
jgi:hypothetical protein